MYLWDRELLYEQVKWFFYLSPEIFDEFWTIYMVAPRYNAVVGVHEARYRLYSARGATTPKTPQQQPKPMCWLRWLYAWFIKLTDIETNVNVYYVKIIYTVECWTE